MGGVPVTAADRRGSVASPNSSRGLASSADDVPGTPPPLGSMPTTASASYADRSALLTSFDRFASAVERPEGWERTP